MRNSPLRGKLQVVVCSPGGVRDVQKPLHASLEGRLDLPQQINGGSNHCVLIAEMDNAVVGYAEVRVSQGVESRVISFQIADNGHQSIIEAALSRAVADATRRGGCVRLAVPADVFSSKMREALERDGLQLSRVRESESGETRTAELYVNLYHDPEVDRMRGHH